MNSTNNDKEPGVLLMIALNKVKQAGVKSLLVATTVAISLGAASITQAADLKLRMSASALPLINAQ